MKMKKIIIGAALVVFVMSTACFATDMLNGTIENQAAELAATVDEALSDEAILTLESGLDQSLKESEETQVAFADLTEAQVQETVNAALGMDIDEIREKFLIPENAIYITSTGDMVNFQMMQPMVEVVDYYQIQFARQGLHYEENLSDINSVTTTMVYSGHSNGKMMIIQLVALNQGQTSVTIVYED